MEKAHPEIRTAQSMTHSVRILAAKPTAVLPAEHTHFIIVSAKAVDMLIDSVVTLLVAQSEQALHPAITELEHISSGMESGKWTDDLQKTSVWPDLVYVQATSNKATNNTTISDKMSKGRGGRVPAGALEQSTNLGERRQFLILSCFIQRRFYPKPFHPMTVAPNDSSMQNVFIKISTNFASGPLNSKPQKNLNPKSQGTLNSKQRLWG